VEETIFEKLYLLKNGQHELIVWSIINVDEGDFFSHRLIFLLFHQGRKRKKPEILQFILKLAFV
jgi:hypothetical protein